MFDSTGFVVTAAQSVTFTPSTANQQIIAVSIQITNESDTDTSKARVHLLDSSLNRLSTPFKQPLEPEETVSISDKIFLSSNKSLKFEAIEGSFSVTISHFNAGK